MTYKCGFCGTEYENPAEYAECVTKCMAEKKRNDERVRKETLEKEKNERLEDLKRAEKTYNSLLTRYINDYGYYDSNESLIRNLLFQFGVSTT